MLAISVAALILMNLVAVAITSLGVARLYDQNIRAAESHSQNLALAIDLSVSAEISKIDLSLKTVRAEIGRHVSDRGRRGWDEISSVLHQQKTLLPEVEGWSIANARGDVVLDGGETGGMRFSIADRVYFGTLQSSEGDRLQIAGPLTSRATGSEVLIFGRKIFGSDGAFDGAVVIALPVVYLNRLLSGYDVGPHGAVTLRHQTLDVITRIVKDPAGDSVTLTVPSLSSQFSRLVSQGVAQATYTAMMPFDGVERIASYRKLSGADLYTVVAVSKEDQLGEWRKIAWRSVGLLAVLLCMANGAAWFLYRFWQRQHRSTAQLKESNAQLQTSLRQLRERDSALVSAQQAGRLGTYVLDIERERWTSSEMLDAIFGMEPSTLHSVAEWEQLLHADDRESVVSYLFDDVVAKRLDFDREYRVCRPSDGRTVWVHGLGRLEFSDDGRPIRMLGTVQDVTALKAAQQDLERMAYYDVTTGLANRVLLADRMRQAISRCRRHAGELLAVCHLDLDGFKEVNDRWGHAVGDRLLASVAERFQGAVRGNDTVARLGGDEFVVIFCDLKNIVAVENAVLRLLESAAAPHRVDGMVISSTVSIGVTVFPDDASDEPDVLVRHADQAMYEAKRNGKNCVHYFDPQNDRALKERQSRYKRIVDALANNELRLFYQPKVDLRTGAVSGVEALIRWQHPEDGLLQPGQFLPAIEATELTLPVGEWVLNEALRQIGQWASQGIELPVSVNIFALHLQRCDFADRLKALLQAYPEVAPGALELEILETTALEDLPAITQRIERCTALGVQFSLDDFGTGYSSLTYLRNLPVKTVKIDRSFVGDMLVDREDQALVQGLVAMAHAVQRRVVAEGVETLEHASALLRCGCDEGQGFGIGRPMPPEAIPGWLKSWHAPAEWTALGGSGDGTAEPS